MSSTKPKRKRSVTDTCTSTTSSVRSKRSKRSCSSSSSTATQTTLASASQNDDKVGRDIVHERLRSILMSPTSYTLFHGFNQKKSSEKNGAVYVHSSELEIDGLPDPLPDFFFDKPRFRSLFSNAFKEAAVIEATGDDENKNIDVKAASIPDTSSALKTDKSSSADAVDTFKEEGDTRPLSGAADSSTTTPAKAKEDVDVDDDSHAAIDKADVSKKDDDEAAADKMYEMLRLMETNLTTKVIDRIQEETEKGTVQFCAEKETRLSKGKGRTDLILTRKMKSQKTSEPEESKKIPVGLVEFGLLDKEEKLEQVFWEKMHQTTRYLTMLRTESIWKWKKSLLLGVFVATRNCLVGRLAVFACEPKGTDRWRMALLWRSQLESRDKLSEAFGAFLNAADYLAGTGDDEVTKAGDDEVAETGDDEVAETGDGEVAKKEKKITWEYLGPDCTLVEIKGKFHVARSFDNRGQHSSRTPRVYKDWDKLSEDMIDLFIIQDNADSDNTLDFAAKDEGYELNDKSMLFSKWNELKGGKNVEPKGGKNVEPKGGKDVEPKGGKVEVIAVPYHEGTHVCTSFIQLLSLLYYVKDMLEKGFVHGDMRGRNMVFKPPPKNLKRSDFLLESSDPKESQEIHERLKRLESHHPESATSQVATADLQEVAKDPPLSTKKQLGTDDPQVADQQGSDSTGNQPIAKDIQTVSAESDPDAAHAKDRKLAEDEGVKIDPTKFVYACLIDFDYGGHLDDHKPTYPPGYRQDVGDGIRNKGNEREAIKPEHDITAMTNVLDLHKMKGHKSSYVLSLWNELLESKDLDQQIELATKLFRLHPTGVICAKETYTDRLKKYSKTTDRLTAKGGNKVTPDRYGKAIDDE